MIGYSKKNRENYATKCFRLKDKETRVKTKPMVSANRRSNNWALAVLLLALGACDEDRISQTSIVFWSLPALYLNFDLILIRSKLGSFASQKLANLASQKLADSG